MMKKLLVMFLIIIIECSISCSVAFASDGSSKEQAIEIENLDELYYGTIAKGQNDWYKLVTGSEDAYYYCTFTNETGEGKNVYI